MEIKHNNNNPIDWGLVETVISAQRADVLWKWLNNTY